MSKISQWDKIDFFLLKGHSEIFPSKCVHVDPSDEFSSKHVLNSYINVGQTLEL